MTAAEILGELRPLGRESYRKVMVRHGVEEPLFGVKIEELKKIQKRIGNDYQLALDLFDTGNYDAMYLAGLIADDARMTRRDLQHWLEHPKSAPLLGSIVPWVAAGSAHGWAVALEWIDSGAGRAGAAGWATLGGLVSIKPDADLDLAKLRQFLARVGKTIHAQPDNVRYAMNGFVIAVGGYVASLTDLALQTAERIGTVRVDMGDTACQVLSAPDHIRKIQQRGTVGKKRKTVKC